MFNNREELFTGRGELFDLIGLLYETVGEARLWPQALAAIAESFQAQCGGIIFRDELTPGGTVNVDYQFDPANIDSYHAYYGPLDVWFAASRHVLSGTAMLSTDFVANHDLKKTEFYNDFLKSAHIEHQCGILLEREGSRFGALTLTRGADQKAFRRDDVERLTALTPHLRRVLRLNTEISKIQTKVSGLVQMLDALDRIVFGLSVDGRVLFSSSRAEIFLSSDRGISRTGDRLRLQGVRQDIEFQAMLVAASIRGCREFCNALGATFVLPNLTSLRIVALPYLGGPIGLGSARLGTLLFVDDGSSQPASRSEILRVLYGLTPTELRIVQLLVAGQDVKTIAGTIATNQNLVRFHLKNVFRKMGAGRQSDVIKAVLSLPADTVSMART
jgi:DNA-binding CsgD family transcriptional regulator